MLSKDQLELIVPGTVIYWHRHMGVHAAKAFASHGHQDILPEFLVFFGQGTLMVLRLRHHRRDDSVK